MGRGCSQGAHRAMLGRKEAHLQNTSRPVDFSELRSSSAQGVSHSVQPFPPALSLSFLILPPLFPCPGLALADILRKVTIVMVSGPQRIRELGVHGTPRDWETGRRPWAPRLKAGEAPLGMAGGTRE